MLEALDMGKYAFYVWGSYAVTAAALVLEVLWLRHRRRTIQQRVGRTIRLANEANS